MKRTEEIKRAIRKSVRMMLNEFIGDAPLDAGRLKMLSTLGEREIMCRFCPFGTYRQIKGCHENCREIIAEYLASEVEE